ncbi:MAG: signal peptide peptidase SppA [Hyphomonadaceae bacterium]|nr:signal peptide peptidase SppA [Hyphomonadaceae bacterium]
MKQFLITVAGVLAGLILFLVIGPIILISAISSSMNAAPAAPSAMVLALDLREEMTDQRPQSPLAAFGAGPSLMDVVQKLDAAATDDRVKGVYIRANTDGTSPAHAEELRDALARVRAAGKFVIAHVQGDGVRLSMAGFAAVAGADAVYLQGSSEFMPMGLAAEGSFFADTLRRFRMQAQFEAREEYKTAANSITESGFTPSHREETLSLMNGVYDNMIAHIAADRDITPAAVRAAIDGSPYTAERAKELKLIDEIGRPEDAERAALARAGEGAEIVEFAAYHPRPASGGDVIAVVGGEGEIVSGVPDGSPFGGDILMNSDAIARALLDAGEDEDVKAIIFRVSSPGGSVVASDQILHALRTVRENGKRVVISMGDVAASGGYYVAAEADEIVASPSTITGSIGVIGGKIVLGPALEHYLSVRTETLTVGSPLVTMFSADQPFTNEGRTAFAGYVDRAYQEFLQRVATGRRLTVAQVREVARGRVWTGAQAKERGLVDHLGGFQTALARARALGGIDENATVQLRMFPAERSPIEELQELLGVSASQTQALAVMSRVLGEDATAAALVAALDRREAAVRAEAAPVRIR